MRENPRPRQILEFVRDFSERRGYSPSYREIAEHCGIKSLNCVNRYVLVLERRGMLTHRKNISRALVVTEKGREWLGHV